ncbi:hypothetical protein F6X37_23015 [Paraburkholderia sp. 31.1]|uniref:hypothetical protein n=1 Tax=Paraburkholderia sp. 31.1 TaxID=2615205 RepID=UPI0016550C05|nr:hypothetical protein [Paraburkholderia sp. 31.1]MBC8724354.1 hypothetical protein [Paraburkholderia sp. 31.1]
MHEHKSEKLPLVAQARIAQAPELRSIEPLRGDSAELLTLQHTRGNRFVQRVVEERIAARDFDQNMQDAAQAGGNAGASDIKVQVIIGHTTAADENEARRMLTQIDDAEKMVERNPDVSWTAGDASPIGPMKGYLVENHQARFVLEQYLAGVSETGDFQSEYATSYIQTKKDYGAFMALWSAFQAGGGALGKGLSNKLAALSKDPEFLRARTAMEAVRNNLVDDRTGIVGAIGDKQKKNEELNQVLYAVGKMAAQAAAKSKQTELNTLNANIKSAVDTIMTVGKIAATATSGVLAFGEGGLDMNKLIESNPEIAPANPVPATPSLAPPDVSKFATPGTDLNPHGIAQPEDGLGKPNDTRSYLMPSQTIDTAKSLGAKGLSALGGPDKMLTAAITMLEQTQIDRLQADIDAANEDGNLKEAASVASDVKAKRLAYAGALRTLSNYVINLMAHKAQLDVDTNAMIAAAKTHGVDKSLTGGLRLLNAGDKFLAQVGVTIEFGLKQQASGSDALAKRTSINADPSGAGTPQGPGQLHYWTVDYDRPSKRFLATKHAVTLAEGGKDSLANGVTSNSTQFDVGKSVQELKQWENDVHAIRDRAQSAMNLQPDSGTSKQ